MTPVAKEKLHQKNFHQFFLSCQKYHHYFLIGTFQNIIICVFRVSCWLLVEDQELHKCPHHLKQLWVGATEKEQNKQDEVNNANSGFPGWFFLTFPPKFQC